jgi:hypothetical protein
VDLTGQTPAGQGADYQRTLEAAQAIGAEAAIRLTETAATEAAVTRATAVEDERIRKATQLALDVRGTEVALSLTQSVATQSAEQTATWVVATQQQVAFNDAVQKTKTALDLAELNRQNKAAQDTQTFNTWAGRIGVVTLAGLLLGLLVHSWPWILLRFFGIDTTSGKLTVIIPNRRGGITSIDPSRGFGPGLASDRDGAVIVTGTADDPEIQDRVTGRAQAGDLVRALPRFGASSATTRQVLTQANGMGAQALPSPPVMRALPPGDVIEGLVREVDPDDPEIKVWMDDVQDTLLGPGQ